MVENFDWNKDFVLQNFPKTLTEKKKKELGGGSAARKISKANKEPNFKMLITGKPTFVKSVPTGVILIMELSVSSGIIAYPSLPPSLPPSPSHIIMM